MPRFRRRLLTVHGSMSPSAYQMKACITGRSVRGNDTTHTASSAAPGSDLRKFPVRNVRVLHSVVDLPPGGSFPLWNTAKDFFVMENPWMKNLDVTRR